MQKFITIICFYVKKLLCESNSKNREFTKSQKNYVIRTFLRTSGEISDGVTFRLVCTCTDLKYVSAAQVFILTFIAFSLFHLFTITSSFLRT